MVQEVHNGHVSKSIRRVPLVPAVCACSVFSCQIGLDVGHLASRLAA